MKLRESSYLRILALSYAVVLPRCRSVTAALACCLTLDSRGCLLNRRWPVDWDWEHTNVVSDTRHGAVAAQLHRAVTQCT
jgi:hypothetical protein